MKKSVPKQVCARALVFVLLLASGLLGQAALPLRAEPMALYLEVYVNGQSTKLTGAFERYLDGRISTAVSELKELGLKSNGVQIADKKIFLDEVAGLSYRYDEAAQKLYIETNETNRLARNYTAGQKSDRLNIARPGFGMVLNYSVNASAKSGLKTNNAEFEGISSLLNIGGFGPYGVLSSSVLLNSATSGKRFVTLLDTNWSYADESRLISYTVGDVISGGPSWARPTRMVGVRVHRNFSIRPDLVTQPLAGISGSAALPSTVDIYIRNTKTHSQQVAAGPFTLSDIPSITGNGTARIVVRDATGRETVTYSDFFLSPQMLAAGLWDFSAELGLARGNFGEKSFDYSTKPYFSGSVRYGWQGKATLDGHIEAGKDLLLVGGGVTLPIANKALVSFSGAGSYNSSGRGFLLATSLETSLFGFAINAQSRRSFGQFKDIAAVTANDFGTLSGNTSAILSAAKFPRAFDQISIGVPFPDWGASFNTSLVHTRSGSGKANAILAASFSKKLFADASFFATAFTDIKDFKSPGFFAGLSIPLGRKASVSTGGTYSQRQGWRATATYSKPLGNEIGSFGWRLQDQEGNTSVRNASVSYRGSTATIEGRISQNRKSLEYSTYVQGAFAFTKSGVFAANRIDDSFAIVDVGAAGVPVLIENRPIGKTNSSGKLLIPNLTSYDKNRISIDPTDLPVNVNVPVTTKLVVPSYRSGVVVKFDVQTQSNSAILTIHDRFGKPLEAGTAGKFGGQQIDVVVGFDGRVFIEGLSPYNQIIFATRAGPCKVTFDFRKNSDIQVEIGPLTCT